MPERSDAPADEAEQIGQNITAVHEFYSREEHKRSFSRRQVERIGAFVGTPAFLVAIVLLVAAWMGINLALPAWGMDALDEAPFFWMQGAIALGSLLTTTVVLIKQERVAKLSEQRAHLELKVALLTEQKSAKVIDLIEELRRDLPSVKDRKDPGAAVLQRALRAEEVLEALDEAVTLRDGSLSASAAAEPVAEDAPVADRDRAVR